MLTHYQFCKPTTKRMTHWFQQRRADLYACGAFALVFILFFWPVTFGGRFLVTNDALLYSYPLRTLGWQMIRSGELPLWTPNILAGYPLLSMAQLALLYPLTWGYLFLSGHAAEQVYVLAPYLLAPMFLYAYVRKLGVSPLGAWLAGLSFAYSGAMLSPLGEGGFHTNGMLWLPLFLLALECAREKPLASSLLWATLAYWLSVATGYGQGFLYTGIIGLAYAVVQCWFAPALRRRWQPLLCAVAAIVFSAAFQAWQILETLQAQRSSIRRTMDYATFSGAAFSLTMLGKLLFNPLPHFIGQYNLFAYECTPFVVLLTLLCAGFALRQARQPRIAFWLIVALLGFLLMLGSATPLYRVLYFIPVVNLFRNAWRHAFEWALAVSILAAFGFDWLSARANVGQVINLPYDALRENRFTKNKAFSFALCFVSLLATIALCRATMRPTNSPRQVIAMLETVPVIWPDGLSASSLFIAKLGLTALVAAALWFTWRAFDGKARTVIVACVLAVACLWEQVLIVNHWWFPQAKPAAFFTTVSPASRYLQQFNPAEGRVYTTMIPGFQLDLRRADPHDFSARRGLQDAAGYEPLMPARYNEVFGPGWYFTTPELAAPRDPQIVKPAFKGFDLLNVRYAEWFAASLPSSLQRGDVRFAAQDTGTVVLPHQTQTLHAHALLANRLSLVTTLANSAARRTGEPFARLRLIRADGTAIERTLQVGVDSADFSFGKATNIQHREAALFDILPDNGAHRYWMKHEFDTAVIDRLEIENLTDEVTIYLSRASLYEEGKTTVQALAPRLAGWRKVYDQDGAQLYENPNALPRVWLTDRVRQVTASEALQAVRGETPFDPRAETLLEKLSDRELPSLSERFKQAPQARVTSYAANRLTIETEADAPALLTLSERYAPGWRATLDGQPVPILLANYLLRGVTVPAGKHRVEMHYAAPAARRGLWISLGALLVFLACLMAAHRYRNRLGVRSQS